MASSTVISGGFPGRYAQEVNPNQKCSGCLHYDGQAGRTGACTIGLKPWTCGDGEAPEVSYAPLARGAGSYLPDMGNHSARAPEVDAHAVSGLYGSGSTRPVEIKQVSLGEEHVHVVKSVLGRHAALQKSQCRLCSMRGTYGVAPPNVGPQTCTCVPIDARVVAKAVIGRMTNAQLVGVQVDDVAAWVRSVVKAGFRLPDLKKSAGAEAEVRLSLADQLRVGDGGGHLLPVEKGSHFSTHGRYDIEPAGGGEHHVKYHPKGGGAPAVLPGKFPSPKAARRAVVAHSTRLASGSGSAIATSAQGGETAPTRQIKTRDASSGVPTAAVDKSDAVEKSIYSEDWIVQFRGTELFDQAHKLCEQELSMEEEQLKRREERVKHEKARAAAVAKVTKPNDVRPDFDWQEQDVRREKIRIAKQRLTLKLVGLRQAAVAKSDGPQDLGAKATNLTNMANSTDSVASHQKALAAHVAAASHFKSTGNGKSAQHHQKFADYHKKQLSSR